MPMYLSRRRAVVYTRLYFALEIICIIAYWPALLLFFLSANRIVDAQLISHSILHHITSADLEYFNHTHPDDFEL